MVVVNRAPACNKQCFAAEARPEAGDPRRVDVIPVVRMRKQKVERGSARQWTDRLHLDVGRKMQRGVNRVAEIVDLDIGKARVAVEGRNHDVAVARQHRQRHDVIVGQGAADQPVRKLQHWPPRDGIGPDRRLRAALHCGTAFPVGSG
jgi:hypothetical protein